MPDEETEITLSNGRILGLFIGLVVLCGVLFVMGYMLGKNSAPGNTLLTDAPAGTPADAQIKPAAIQSVQVPCPAPAAPAPEPAPETASTDAPEMAQPAPAQPEPKQPVHSKPEPAPRPAASTPTAGNFTVQVAAISNQQDAARLAAALRKKQYAVFVTNPAGDHLFHVQVGPFSDPKHAEAAKSRLVADGYNAFVKK